MKPDSGQARTGGHRRDAASSRAARRSPARRTDAGWRRPIAGLATVVAIMSIVAMAVALFSGGAVSTVPLTVLSPRAGLVMDPDAKVKLRDIQIGKVASIEDLPDGRAALHLAMDPSQLQFIPSNVGVDIASSTVFGAKFVELIPPADPSPQPIRAGQTLTGDRVTVEINTVFDQLTSMLAKIQPDKLNETLGAIASGLDGRGRKIGQSFADFDHLLAEFQPSLPNLSHDIAVAPEALRAYADVAPQLIATLDNSATIGQTLVDEQQNLDTLLLGTIGLADVGNQVLGDNRIALADVMQLLVPTTDLTNQYHEGLTCGLTGIIPFINAAPLPFPGIYNLASFLWGTERYRYPGDLPKVAATGGSHCRDMFLPTVPYNTRPPFLVADVGTDVWKYGNQGTLLNSEGLKQYLFGPLDGPPRNTAQIGQPG